MRNPLDDLVPLLAILVIFGAPMGEPQHRYYAEFEWPDLDAFKAAARSPEFAETARDATAMDVPYSVEFAEID